MVDQRERIISQIHELELALARTDDKIANYGGAPWRRALPRQSPQRRI